MNRLITEKIQMNTKYKKELQSSNYVNLNY